ncbi:MAG: cytidine deaminase [Caldilineaceae bacterium]
MNSSTVNPDILIHAATQARQNAYAPYSRYLVGAAVLLVDGTIVAGCNVENASYPATICAERVALTSAVAQGHRDFVAIAVVTANGGTPCGICRQVMAELGPGMAVYISDTAGNFHITTVAELLPGAFRAIAWLNYRRLSLMKLLAQVVAEKPYPDFNNWWPMGGEFLAFMAEAIGSQWQRIVGENADPASVQTDVELYIRLVYQRVKRPTLAIDFLEKQQLSTIQSGEFDALSYAFYKSAFENLARNTTNVTLLQQARHTFTQHVGKIFYNQIHDHLALALPTTLQNPVAFTQFEQAVARVGNFLKTQGYLREHFAFRFDVNIVHGGMSIVQRESDVVPRFCQAQLVYALYEMGYPVILPSAVYLYQTLGEAQHHSSRTIEELFGRIGYVASETADFDPTGYPSDLVVELWEIRARED